MSHAQLTRSRALSLFAVILSVAGSATAITACGPTQSGAGPVIETHSVSDAEVGAAYRQALSVAGGRAPYVWNLEKPAALEWLTIRSDSGELGGTPGEAVVPGEDFTVTVTDADGGAASQRFTLAVRMCAEGSTRECFFGDGERCQRGIQECQQGAYGPCAGNGELSTSLESCGTACEACDNAADGCLDGVCACGGSAPCGGEGESCCGGGCVDVRADLENCGACGNSCTEDAPAGTRPTCSVGSCLYPCAEDHARCPAGAEACTNLMEDPANCNGCGNVCRDGSDEGTIYYPACEAGECRYACKEGPWIDVDELIGNGCEVDTRTDVAHCGGKNQPCGPAPHVTGRTCSAGQCVITTCDPGWVDHDRTYQNGCEASTQTHPDHCGAPNNACPPKANATRTCSNGQCSFTCMAGWGDCDGNPANGCERRLNGPNACGACGNVCGSNQSCHDDGYCCTWMDVGPGHPPMCL